MDGCNWPGTGVLGVNVGSAMVADQAHDRVSIRACGVQC
jgi:hypothetical protein